MDVAIIIALIALLGSIVSTVVTAFGAPAHQERRAAEVVMERYRQPLLAAAFDLQSRLYNVLRGDFVERYLRNESPERREAALMTTIYVLAQYLCWREIIRREVQFLRFRRTRETREVAELLNAISEALLTDDVGTQLMIWRVEQRGIGARMIVEREKALDCVDYSRFLTDDALRASVEPIAQDLRSLNDAGRSRLTEVQRLALRLVRTLDSERLQYPMELLEA